ncbi:hypothetical protein VD0002_g4339 [Verticillium dahliae]|uniref:Uncharacterized protein n=1 Tax=Verticillium dahliae TaxID=27337 RepID=A0AA44WL83_VERDA|nr:hypothetical protein BJF96_g3653 [Verticillium dahliae]PNH40385.1 hypothetical protein VD0004_g6594 [Verticillium dahliae]PNH52566.1 hypothetical protein VD0003_g4781 [Verticillium dahliae]PNH64275.1 hypothetical protein VD0002_g4339 [Verticillium dahliae]PNH70924.1 hypothetical protein VD0001_g6638 [Verticillium dahliae]
MRASVILYSQVKLQIQAAVLVPPAAPGSKPQASSLDSMSWQ